MGENSFFDLVGDDVEEGILLKIQCEKSILRCTSVCKSWCYLIKSSQFINTHLSRPDKTKYLFCKSVHATCNSHSVMEYGFSLYSDSAPSDKYCTSVLPCIPAGVRIRGSCSGVICYSLYPDCRGDIFLWNPTIRKLKTLPRSPARRHISRAIGFWFDKDKNDHLIVKITYTNASQMSSVDVYSLSSNCWRTISDACPGAGEDSILDVNLDYDEGTLRWLALHEQSGRIVTLDMNTAEFRQTLISVCYV
ncbi:hypothetical protein DCAR_0414795 [Daucus carota subsp. sativus]|uniref:F-box associated beta-propeller type 1 domain-containing protein n=1 Tax=Daucus carota subsp. sativus TaxID=79200 RepID=A0A165A0Y4_DAUCS|nr:PREDICTED: uncharacterized protein LOC108217010 [Daucus carota subsp. sativus]WOG95476.1 hypothetical protein DCAR_0414795 [Daucus carota subsp. sativus]